MKVIKPGSGQKGWSSEATCTGAGNGNGGCGAVLLVEQPDLFCTSSSCRDETDYFTTFKCSECGVLTDIKTPINPRSLPSYAEWKKSHEQT
jgi:hypothetical protein